MLYQKVVIELTHVTSQGYVININDPRNTNNFIDHLLPKDSVSAHGTPHHAWIPGPPPSKSGAAVIMRLFSSAIKEACCLNARWRWRDC